MKIVESAINALSIEHVQHSSYGRLFALRNAFSER